MSVQLEPYECSGGQVRSVVVFWGWEEGPSDVTVYVSCWHSHRCNRGDTESAASRWQGMKTAPRHTQRPAGGAGRARRWRFALAAAGKGLDLSLPALRYGWEVSAASTCNQQRCNIRTHSAPHLHCFQNALLESTQSFKCSFIVYLIDEQDFYIIKRRNSLKAVSHGQAFLRHRVVRLAGSTITSQEA